MRILPRFLRLRLRNRLSTKFQKGKRNIPLFLSGNAGKILKFILLLIIFGIPFLIPYLVELKDIECVNQYGVCSRDIVESVENFRGQTLWQAKKTISKSLTDNYMVKKFSLHYKLPAKFLVNIVERKPKFALVNKNENKSAIIDSEGKVLSIVETTNLPSVYVNSQIPVTGTPVSGVELFSLRIMSDVYTLFQTSTGELDENGLRILLKDGETVIFPREGDRKVLMGSLIMVLNRLKGDDASSTIEGKSGKNVTIDLRFENPVIR